MANLTLELNINCASNLTNVNLITKMDVYAVITIHGDDTRKNHKVKTNVDRSGGSNPTWNHAVTFSVNERLVRDGRLRLVMRLISRRVLGNKDIGGVNVPLLELLSSITPSNNGDGNGNGMKFVTYQVKSPSGKRKGSLTFSYRFNTPLIKPVFPAIVNRRSTVFTNLPSTVYPPLPSKIERSPLAPPESAISAPLTDDSDHQKHPVVARSNSGPRPLSYGPAVIEQPYFCSSPYEKSGCAYHHAPPSPAGYGYGWPSSQPPKGIELGLGVGVGLLGWLMVGDIVSDVANCFDL